MLKKLLCVLLAALMLVGTLASCGTGNETIDTTASNVTTGAEDENDLSKVEFSLELFEAYVKGFVGEVGDRFRPPGRRLPREGRRRILPFRLSDPDRRVQRDARLYS